MNSRCIVYGAGRIGRELVKKLLDMNHDVLAILDRNPERGGDYMGIPIRPVNNAGILSELKAIGKCGSYDIFIGIANPLENEMLFQWFEKQDVKSAYRGGGYLGILQVIMRSIYARDLL